MKKTLFYFVLLVVSAMNSIFAQDDKTQIEAVIANFQKGIEAKDLEGFLSLFVEGQKVSWVGNGSYGIQFGSPSSFINMLKMTDKTYREDFHNIAIWNDEYIAVVTFDYGFFGNDKLSNWGKESWMLIKQNGQWKITSVNYSMILAHQEEYPFKK
ncbi:MULTISPECIES: YybH family protein [Flavobacteriaceae]|uniref:YybH family protein n=1 Tax=Flavobacteriaceae TaxID=49546 RepID=UPI001491DA26|nr:MULTISPECIES: nuclear transport factor 2 family protein [Allomuricauda]MDC6366972.1 nuclear transport factor 2 family protein [Muricauda sp. AC10]